MENKNKKVKISKEELENSLRNLCKEPKEWFRTLQKMSKKEKIEKLKEYPKLLEKLEMMSDDEITQMTKKTLEIFEIEQVQKIDPCMGNTLSLTLKGAATVDGITTKLIDLQDIDEICFGTGEQGMNMVFVKKEKKREVKPGYAFENGEWRKLSKKEMKEVPYMEVKEVKKGVTDEEDF